MKILGLNIFIRQLVYKKMLIQDLLLKKVGVETLGWLAGEIGKFQAKISSVICLGK